MTLGRIKGERTYNENREFTGMDITGQYLNEKGRWQEVSFHYKHYTNDLRGKVLSVLDASLNSKPLPKLVSDVKV